MSPFGGNRRVKIQSLLYSVLAARDRDLEGYSVQAAEIFVHPNLNRRAGNDYCLVKLTKPLDLDGCKAEKIKLSSKRDDRLYGQRCYSAGWGTVQVDDPRSAVLLKITTRTGYYDFFCQNL